MSNENTEKEPEKKGLEKQLERMRELIFYPNKPPGQVPSIIEETIKKLEEYRNSQ